MIIQDLENNLPESATWDFSRLIQYWKHDSKNDNNELEYAFNQSMNLLAQADINIQRLRGELRAAKSHLQDYRDREATMDVMTLRGEIRALMTQVNSLETNLKLLQSK